MKDDGAWRMGGDAPCVVVSKLEKRQGITGITT